MAPFPRARSHPSVPRVLKLGLVSAGLVCSSIGSAQPSSPIAVSQTVRTIPSVIGMSVNAATDALRWTGLSIVQLATTANSDRVGVVLRQQPQAGTPVSRAKAETLYVSTAPRKPRPKRPSLWDVLTEAVIA